MGREIKRVALDFDWPINSTIWKGYHHPYSQLPCAKCKGSGWSDDYQREKEIFYATGCSIENQAEVDALRESQRIKATTVEGARAEIATSPIGLDSIGASIIAKSRCERRGVPHLCPECEGECGYWVSDEIEALSDAWERIEPPAGDGYQLWSTTTEGHPKSPVFATPEELARWLADTGASSFGRETATYDEWLTFIAGPGWAPSGVIVGNAHMSGVAFAVAVASDG